jgi:hypothetical protein
MDDQPSFPFFGKPLAPKFGVMAEFYKVNYAKISLREYWNLSPNSKAIIAWLMKIVGSPVRDQHAHPHPSLLKQFETTEALVPREPASVIAPVRREIEQMGFHSPKWVHVPALRSNVETTAATFLHNSGSIIGRVMYSKATSPQNTIAKLAIFLISVLKDGRQLVTTNMPPTFQTPPKIVTERRIDAPAAVLYELHKQRLACFPDEEIRKFATVAERDAFIDDSELEAYEFQLRRGLYVPLPETEGMEPRTTLEQAA